MLKIKKDVICLVMSMESKKNWILMTNWTSDLQILHSNAQPNEFKDMQLTWKILIVFLIKVWMKTKINCIILLRQKHRSTFFRFSMTKTFTKQKQSAQMMKLRVYIFRGKNSITCFKTMKTASIKKKNVICF